MSVGLKKTMHVGSGHLQSFYHGSAGNKPPRATNSHECTGSSSLWISFSVRVTGEFIKKMLLRITLVSYFMDGPIIIGYQETLWASTLYKHPGKLLLSLIVLLSWKKLYYLSFNALCASSYLNPHRIKVCLSTQFAQKISPQMFWDTNSSKKCRRFWSYKAWGWADLSIHFWAIEGRYGDPLSDDINSPLMFYATVNSIADHLPQNKRTSQVRKLPFES